MLGLIVVIGLVNLAIAVLVLRETDSDWGSVDQWILSTLVVEAEGDSQEESVVLLHGFTGSPYDFKPLVEELRSRGYRVVVPVVPGQTKAFLPYRRGRYTSEFYVDWVSDLVESETQLRGQKPVLVGLSMGGTLATILAARGDVEKLVLIAPYFGLPRANDLIWRASRILKWILPVFPKFEGGKINDPAGYAEYQPGTYMVSLPAFHQVERLAELGKEHVSRVRTPTLILASPNDQVASFALTAELFGSNNNVQIIEFPRSNHLLLNDYDRNAAVQHIVTFIGS